VNTRSDIDRQAEKEVSGAFLGAYANNPFTNKKIPIWIGEYVLMDYGTGAIMAVPSDDERDKKFAQKFGLEIIDVVDKSMYPEATLSDKLGKMINSDFLNGMTVKKAIKAMNYEVEKRGIGKKIINYKLRDANYSRQRYWGEPFPVEYDADGVVHPMEVSKLPLELPNQDDFKPASGGKSPLARNEDWVNEVPNFTRETDTMPGFAGSSWYFLRYMDANNDDAFASKEAIDYWQEVDLYVGGTEHAVGHLMYSRFWHKFLFDKGLVPTNEPFRKLAKANGKDKYTSIPVHVDFVQNYGDQGSYLNLESINKFIEWRPEFNDAIFECGNGVYHKGVFTSSGEEIDAHLITKSEVGKMSKRYFNVVNPDDVVARYGSDCFRMYEMFLGPIEQSKPWDTKGIDGVSKFLRKFWSLFNDRNAGFAVTDAEPTKDELKVLHTAIKKVTEDIERFSFNTCVAAFMIATNDLIKLKSNNRRVLTDLVKLIAPFAPHMAEELWMQLGHEASVHASDYPVFDEKHLIEAEVEYPISINGKTRGKATFPSTASKDELEKLAMDLEVVKKWTDGKTVRKVIVVPKRMINVVVG